MIASTWHQLRAAPTWQRWVAFYLLTGALPMGVFIIYGFWWAVLVEVALAWPQDRLLKHLTLEYPMPAFVKRLEANGEALRAQAKKEREVRKRG